MPSAFLFVIFYPLGTHGFSSGVQVFLLSEPSRFARILCL